MMTFSTFAGLIFTALLLFSLGCKEPKESQQHPTKGQESQQRPARVQEAQEAVCPRFSEVEVRRVLLILLDRSGSFLDGSGVLAVNSRDDIADLVRRLPPETVILVRYISDKSYSPAEKCLIDVIPGEPVPVHCDNPFDPRCQREQHRYEARLGCLDETRKRISIALLNLAPPRAPRTDIWGAIAAAADILNAYRTSQRAIVLHSDLQDTVGTRLPNHLSGLEGVKVIARPAAVNEGPTEMAQRLAVFSERLSRWGATVEAIPPEVPLDPGKIFPQEN